MAELLVEGESVRIRLAHSHLLTKPTHLSDEEWESWGMSETIPVKIDYRIAENQWTARCVAYGWKFGISWEMPIRLPKEYERIIQETRLKMLVSQITEEEDKGIERLSSAIAGLSTR